MVWPMSESVPNMCAHVRLHLMASQRRQTAYAQCDSNDRQLLRNACDESSRYPTQVELLGLPDCFRISGAQNLGQSRISPKRDKLRPDHWGRYLRGVPFFSVKHTRGQLAN